MAAVESSPDCESNAPKTRKRKQFRWDEKMIENLIDSLQSYKATTSGQHRLMFRVDSVSVQKLALMIGVQNSKNRAIFSTR